MSIGALMAALVVAGCSSGPPAREPAPAPPAPSAPSVTPVPSATSTAPAPPPPSPSATPFKANTRDDTAEPSGTGGLTVTDVRLARQDGFDRVVFELDGPGDAQPGWDAGYTDDPRTAGEGAVVDLPGDATLHVVLRGTGYPDDTGVTPFTGPRPLTSDTELVTAVSWYGTFEGQDDAFVGVTERLPFRVYRLDAPRRVVVEVRR